MTNIITQNWHVSGASTSSRVRITNEDGSEFINWTSLIEYHLFATGRDKDFTFQIPIDNSYPFLEITNSNAFDKYNIQLITDSIESVGTVQHDQMFMSQCVLYMINLPSDYVVECGFKCSDIVFYNDNYEVLNIYTRKKKVVNLICDWKKVGF